MASVADEAEGQQAAEDQPARPAGVQNVQVVRFLLGIERGDERIDRGLAHAVGQREHEHADVQAPVGGVLARGLEDRRGGQRDHRRRNVQQECADQQQLVADAIGEQAEADDREGHAGQSAAGDGAQVGLGEAEDPAPLGQHVAANGKTHPRRDQRQEAGPEDLAVRLHCLASKYAWGAIGASAVLGIDRLARGADCDGFTSIQATTSK